MIKIGNNSFIMRKQNTAFVKLLIYKYPNISRLEIANRLSLTPATITSIVSEMMEDDMIVEEQLVSNSKTLGRPKIGLHYNITKKYLIGVDCTANRAIIAICDLHGKVVYYSPFKDEPILFEDLIDYIVGTVTDLLKSNNINCSDIIGLGFGNPGKVDIKSGIIISTYQKDWFDKNFYDALSKSFEFPIYILNNIQNRALALDLNMKIEDVSSFCYFFVERGTSCPYVIRLKESLSSVITAGQMGHHKIANSSKVCPICGNSGCLDAIANNTILENEINNKLKNIDKSSLKEIAKTRNINIDDIILAKKSGENWMDEEINNVINYQALALSNVINLMDPEKIYIDFRLVVELNLEKEFESKIRKLILDNRYSKIVFEYVNKDVFFGVKSAALLAFRKAYIGD